MSIATFLSMFNAGSTLFNNLLNQAFVNENNEKNQDFIKQMTQAQWERDDNAHQREVADLAKAGLSPLASTGGLSTSTPYQGNVNETAKYQAPQLDVNSIMNAKLEQDRQAQEKYEFEINNNQRNKEYTLRKEELDTKVQELNIEDKKVENQLLSINNQYNLESRKLDIEEQQFASEMAYKKISTQFPKGIVNPEFIEDEKEFQLKNQQWYDEFNTFLNSLQNESETKSKSHSQGTSKGNSGGGSIGATALGEISLNQSNNGSEFISDTKTESKNRSQSVEAQIESWLSTHPKPIFGKPW